MIKKHLVFSIICIFTSWATTHGAVPTISTAATIAYDAAQKKIGYTTGSGNAARFVDCGAGFTIAANTTVTWNVPATATINNKLTPLTVTGPITFNTSTAQLTLNNNLQFSGPKGVFAIAPQQSFIPNIARADGNTSAYTLLTIDTKNISNFPSAITIPPYTKVIWAATGKTVAGAITIADTSSLTLNADLELTANGSIATSQLSRISTGDFTIYTAAKSVKMASITDTNYKNFTSGFTIAANTCYRWATSKPLIGTISFTDGSYPQLILDTDLVLGKGAKIDSTAISTPKASINTQDYGLIFEDELAILNTLDLVTN